jgi:hypothetical protein
VTESAAKAHISLLPLRVVRPPIELPRATYAQLWHQRTHDDAGHRWLRTVVAEASATPS